MKTVFVLVRNTLDEESNPITAFWSLHSTEEKADLALMKACSDFNFNPAEFEILEREID